MIEKTQLLFGATAFLISFTITPLVRLIAIKYGWVARPRDDRWHKKTTALLGGVAIFLGISLPLFIAGDFQTLWNKIFSFKENGDFSAIASAIFCGATLLFLLGLADDFLNLKPQNKLIGQIIVASMIVFLGFRLNWFTSLTLDTIITLAWIVGITNAFNLLDNMDGLCAGIAMVAALIMAVLYVNYDSTAFSVALILAGSCCGFLVYNFKPASIFMGDCGSLVIGFSIAVLSLYHGKLVVGCRLSAFAVPLLILMVPLLDTTLVTIIRLLSGRKASTGGRDHTSHRLVLMGFSEKSAVLFLYAVGAVSGIAAVLVSHSDSMTSPAVIIPVLLAIILMGIYLSQLRVYPEKEFSVLRERKFTPILIELTYKRHMMMVILDFGLVSFAYYLAYRLRFGGSEFEHYFNVFLKSLPVIIAVKMVVFYFTGIYRGFWQYISTPDVYYYSRSSVFATLLAITCMTLLYRFKDFSVGVFIIDWILTTLFLLGTRGSFRLFTETIKRKTVTGNRAIIYGAGQGGELLLREILNNKRLKIKPVGFLDDDPLKIGKKIQGYTIFGSFDQLPVIKEKQGIQGVILSFNGKASQGAKTKAIEYCRKNELFLKRFSIQLEPIDIK